MLKILYFFLIFVQFLVFRSREYSKKTNFKNLKNRYLEHTPKERAEKIVSQMSLDEKISMCHGYGYDPIPYVGFVRKLEKYKIPELHLMDGPNGVGDKFTKVTCFPCALAVASTFDRDLMEKYSSTIAKEQRGKGTNIMLSPMVNLARVPFGGRNFESFGEDPYLASELTKRCVIGIQKMGVISCVKHWALNNQEENRQTVSANVDDRTQHELYYRPFYAAVKSGVGAFMCGYNKVNGTHDCENKKLLTNVLKEWLGFEGFVMSDWDACHSPLDANAGLDMEMPTGGQLGQKLKNAVLDGKVSESRVSDMVVRTLTSMFVVGIMDNPQTGNYSDDVQSQEHTEFAQYVAERSTVLLKNDAILPLDVKNIKRIAVIGDAAIDPIVTGGGSGCVRCSYVVTPLEGIKIRSSLEKSISVIFASSQTIEYAVKIAKEADVAIVFASTYSKEGEDRPTLGLGDDTDNLIKLISNEQQHTIIVVQNPGAVTMPWIDNVKAVLLSWYSGQMSGSAISSIIFGDSNPSAKLPLSFPHDDNQTPLKTKIQYPGVDGVTEYTEKLLIGYRWYDEENEIPLFPFGHGLSYTTFEYVSMELSSKTLFEGGRIKIKANISNFGDVEGREVVQLYLSFPIDAKKPPKILLGFEGICLEASESGIVNFTVEYGEDISIWDTVNGCWKVISGIYGVKIGSSSRDLRLHDEFEVV